MTVLADADFYAPLKNSLLLTKGSGNPTFNRTTIATVFDNEGKLVTVPFVASRFSGARCVINVMAFSEDLTQGWTKIGATATSSTLTEDTTTSLHGMQRTITMPATAYLTLSAKIKATRRYALFRINDGSSNANAGSVVFDLLNGTISSFAAYGTYTNCSGLISSADVDGFYRCQITVQAGANTSSAAKIYAATSDSLDANGLFTPATLGDGTSTISIKEIQYENVTGQSDKTASEYVSTSVLSTPYHGAGADGIKYFATNKDGSNISDSVLLGYQAISSIRTNNLLWCRDLTNAAWSKTNVAAAITQTGIDSRPNACSLLTATASDATILQSITATASARSSSFYVKRSVGSGSVYFTQNGGTDWTDITSLINSSTFTHVKIENVLVTNPQVGFKIATSGDAIIVDYGQNETGTECSMPILTTTASVTRNADVLTYQTSGNFSDTAGTILSTVMRENWANNNGSVVGSSTRGLYTSASNSGAQGLDGANTVNGPAGSIITQRKIGMKWSGSSLQVFAGGNFGSSGSYDGSFNLSTVAIMPGTNGYVRDVAIWQSSLSDADMLSAASFQSDMAAVGIGAATITNNYIHSASAVAAGLGNSTFANNYIHSVDASASGIGLATIANNYIHSISATADGVGGLSADAVRVKYILSRQTIEITYYQPSITISI